MADFQNLILGTPWGDDWIAGQPYMRRINDREVVLTRPYQAEWLGGKVRVEKGFVSDLSSIPRVLHSIIPKTGLHDGPSVIHDWCYVNLWESRERADDLFLHALKAAGVGWLRRNTLYLGVRAGGWVLWNRRKEREAANA